MRLECRDEMFVLEMVARIMGQWPRWMYIDVNTLIQVTFEKLGFNISFNVLSVCIQAKCVRMQSPVGLLKLFLFDTRYVIRFWDNRRPKMGFLSEIELCF